MGLFSRSPEKRAAARREREGMSSMLEMVMGAERSRKERIEEKMR